MEHQLCYDSIKPHLNTLRAWGFYQIDPNSSIWKRYIHRAYMAFILSYNIIYTVQQMMKVNEVRYDPDKVIEIMFLMLTYSEAIFKEVILWKHEDKIEELLNMLKGPLFNQNDGCHRVLLQQRARQSKWLLRVFNGAALSTCLLWLIYPAIRYVQSKHVELTIWLPFNPDVSPHIYFALMYNWIQTTVLAIGNTSMDAFITFFFAQSKTQLSILRVDLENIVTKCEDESKDTSQSFAQVFHRRFYKIIMHYNEIVKVCQKTQDIFGGVILYLFLVNVWVICTSAYVMVNVNPISIQFSSMCLYMSCILTEICLYCYYGNEVAYESIYLMESAFCMDWHRVPLKQRYNIIVFMERIKRPIIPMAGAFVPLSNATFVSILRSSYSFYAFLKNTDE